MLLAPVDWALRGGTCALVLLTAGVLLRDHHRLVSARLGALFAIGTAASAVSSAAGFSPRLGLWTVPLLALSAGNNVVFWTLAAALFDDGFHPRRWRAGLWVALVFAVLATVQAVATWRADLVEGRRRLRLFVVGASSAYIALTAAAQLAGVQHSTPEAASLTGAVGLLAIAGIVAWSLLAVGRSQSLFAVPLPAERPAAVDSPDPADREPIDLEEKRLVARLERLMVAERAYRQDGLTIGKLAEQLDLPEYRLRRLINQALGHRNFNSFVNRYRIADVKAALADPGQAEVPVLTIALDAGFSSLGPFNRAFKTETGLTPTEYRRQHFEKSGDFKIGEPIPDSARPIPKSASTDLITP